MLRNGEAAFGKGTQKLAEVNRRRRIRRSRSRPRTSWARSGSCRESHSVRAAAFLLAQALFDGRDRLVAKLQKLCKISDRTFAGRQIQTFASRKDWRRFAELARRAQPLPWDVCRTNERREEAVVFIRKIGNAEQRLALFEQYEYWGEAAGAAAEIKSPRWAELNAKAKAAGEE
jgi:hypothetical protein